MYDVTCEVVATEPASFSAAVIRGAMTCADAEDHDLEVCGPLWHPADEEVLDNLYFVPA